jgi:hypothetical protein
MNGLPHGLGLHLLATEVVHGSYGPALTALRPPRHKRSLARTFLGLCALREESNFSIPHCPSRTVTPALSHPFAILRTSQDLLPHITFHWLQREDTMASRRITFSAPHTLTPLGQKLFAREELNDCDRTVWLMAGFGPYAAISHIRLGVNVADARFLRNCGGDSSDFQRSIASGRDPSVLADLLARQVPHSWPSHGPAPTRHDLIKLLASIPVNKRTNDWAELIATFAPDISPLIEQLIAEGFDEPSLLTRCVALRSVPGIQKFTQLITSGATFTEAGWRTHFPKSAHRLAWQLTTDSCFEAVLRRHLGQRPLDAHEGAELLEPDIPRRRRVGLYSCLIPFACWRRDGGTVHPNILHLLRSHVVPHQKIIEILKCYGYTLTEQLQPDIPGLGVAELAGKSITHGRDSCEVASVLGAFLSPQQALNLIRKGTANSSAYRAAFDHPLQNFRLAVARQAAHLPDLMIRASVDPDPEMRMIAALSPHTPPQVLADLANDRAKTVRLAVSRNSSSPHYTATEVTQ